MTDTPATIKDAYLAGIHGNRPVGKIFTVIRPLGGANPNPHTGLWPSVHERGWEGLAPGLVRWMRERRCEGIYIYRTGKDEYDTYHNSTRMMQEAGEASSAQFWSPYYLYRTLEKELGFSPEALVHIGNDFGQGIPASFEHEVNPWIFGGWTPTFDRAAQQGPESPLQNYIAMMREGPQPFRFGVEPRPFHAAWELDAEIEPALVAQEQKLQWDDATESYMPSVPSYGFLRRDSMWPGPSRAQWSNAECPSVILTIVLETSEYGKLIVDRERRGALQLAIAELLAAGINIGLGAFGKWCEWDYRFLHETAIRLRASWEIGPTGGDL